MNGSAKHINLKITKSELDVINDIVESKTGFFGLGGINGKVYKRTFENIDKANEPDGLTKDKLIYKGFFIFQKKYRVGVGDFTQVLCVSFKEIKNNKTNKINMKYLIRLTSVLILVFMSSCEKNQLETPEIIITLLDDVTPTLVRFEVEDKWEGYDWVFNDTMTSANPPASQMIMQFCEPGPAKVDLTIYGNSTSKKGQNTLQNHRSSGLGISYFG